MYETQIAQAKVLVEALPYIKKFFGHTIVVKYGGSLMADAELRGIFASDITLLRYVGLNPVVVHGGGKEISRWMERLGKEAVFVEGLRVTDAETMEVTEMILSGKINSEVVSLINHAGGRAVGLSGKDADVFIARKIRSETNQDLGFVGDVLQVNPELLHTLAGSGYIPVISSVGKTLEGETVNLNADTVASHIAHSLSAQKLIYITDVQGVMKDGALLPTLTLREAKQLLTDPSIRGGMIPKLKYAIQAIEKGVKSVHIINGTIPHSVLLEVFTDVGIGTMISS